ERLFHICVRGAVGQRHGTVSGGQTLRAAGVHRPLRHTFAPPCRRYGTLALAGRRHFATGCEGRGGDQAGSRSWQPHESGTTTAIRRSIRGVAANRQPFQGNYESKGRPLLLVRRVPRIGDSLERLPPREHFTPTSANRLAVWAVPFWPEVLV